MEKVKTERISILRAIGALFGNDDINDELNKDEKDEIANLMKQSNSIKKLEEELSNTNSSKKKNGGFSSGYKVNVESTKMKKINKNIKEKEQDENIR